MGRKIIYCHPDNLELVRRQLETEEMKQRKEDEDFIHYIRPALWDVELRANSAMEKERPTGKYQIECSDFHTWWDGTGEPPSWALFFGLVKPIMEMNFVIIEERGLRFFHDFKLPRYTPSLLVNCIT